MVTLTTNEYQAFARNDLYTFIHRAFRELNPTTPFLPYLAQRTDRVEAGSLFSVGRLPG